MLPLARGPALRYILTTMPSTSGTAAGTRGNQTRQVCYIRALFVQINSSGISGQNACPPSRFQAFDHRTLLPVRVSAELWL